MKFSCPNCRKECDFMVVQLDADLRAIIAMSDGFGRHRVLAWAYAELFGITPFHAKAKKARVILEAVKKLFDSESFSYQKKLYAISQAGIAEALNIVVQRNFQDGLDSHNYLKKIMIGIAEREAKAAGRQAEKNLRTREGRLMSGSRDSESSFSKNEDSARYPIPEEQVEAPAMRTMPTTRTPTDAEFEERRQQLKAMINKIGG